MEKEGRIKERIETVREIIERPKCVFESSANKKADRNEFEIITMAQTEWFKTDIERLRC